MSRSSAVISLGLAPSNNPSVQSPSLINLPNLPTDSEDEGINTGTKTTSRLSTPGPSAVPPSASSKPAATVTSDSVPASFASASPSQNLITNGQSHTLSPGAIVGILLGVLILIGLILFFVRRHFVAQRASKVTPARSRLSRIVISGPSDFQHVSSASSFPHVGGAQQFANGGREEMWNSPSAGGIDGRRETPATARPRQTELQRDEAGGVWAATESPYGRKQPKYTVDFGNLESGLHDYVRTMEGARKAPPGM